MQSMSNHRLLNSKKELKQGFVNNKQFKDKLTWYVVAQNIK